MFIYTIAFISASTIFVCTQCAFVDTLQKCALKDEACLIGLYKKVFNEIGATGIPELGIPPVDPIELKNVSVSILGLVDITLIEGVAKGIKSCGFTKFTVDIEKERGSNELTCDLIIEGKYKVYSESPPIKNFLKDGTSIHGEGNGKVELEKLIVKFDFPVNVQKRDDGEIYIKCDFKKITYDYDILGKTRFFADNLYIGEQEASKNITNFLNENWKFVMGTFGRTFVDKAMEFYYEFSGKFFETVPAKNYLTDDLTSYAKP